MTLEAASRARVNGIDAPYHSSSWTGVWKQAKATWAEAYFSVGRSMMARSRTSFRRGPGES
jgi:hypothetical protein